MTGGNTGAIDIELCAVDAAQAAIQPQFVLAEIFVFPGFHGAQSLSGKGFVNLIKIKILQVKPARANILGTA